MNFDFGELKNDTNFVSKVEASSEAISKIEKTIQKAIEMKTDDMSVEEKVKFDLFLVYAVNSLYFMSMRVNGDDISSHGIKDELGRIKESMQRHQQILDKDLRPTLNQDVTKRFVRGGLYDFKKKNEEFRRRHQKAQYQQQFPTKISTNFNPNAPNRKRKFDD